MSRFKDKHPPKGSSFGDSPQTYEARAVAYMQRSGRANGEHPVIKAGSREWVAWMDYFEHIGHPHGRAGSFARQRGSMTVPARWPDDFEPGWRSLPKADVGRTDLQPAKRSYQPAIAFDHDWTDEELASENVVINGIGRPYVMRPPKIYLSSVGRRVETHYGFLTPKEAEIAEREIGEQNPKSTKTQEEKSRAQAMYDRYSRGSPFFQSMREPARPNNPPPPQRDPLVDPLPVRNISEHLQAQLRGEIPIARGRTGAHPVGSHETLSALDPQFPSDAAE